MTQTLPYGSWPSPLSAEQVTAKTVSFNELSSAGNSLFYLEQRPEEAGRNILKLLNTDGTSKELTSAPFDARSSVHEYGGGSYCVDEDNCYFVNKSDQNIYCVKSDGSAEPRQVTQSDSNERFANLIVDDANSRLICVRELHQKSEVTNELVTVDRRNGSISVLHHGHDFYASVQLSPSGKQIVFLSWDLPDMPWDSTYLYRADLTANGILENIEQIAGGSRESVFQPEFASNDRLVYVSDRTGFWNLYVHENAISRCVLQEEAEYGLPQWMFNMRSYALLDRDQLIAVRGNAKELGLVHVDLNSGAIKPCDCDYSSYSTICKFETGVAFIGGSPNRREEIVFFNEDSMTSRVVISAGELPISQDNISVAEQISYSNQHQLSVHAHYYAPKNEFCTGFNDDVPPLLVMSHGGPTGNSNASFRFLVQYFTTRGWAVLDVNYGGSTGYGREYRERLQGNWGIVDVEDCIAGVKFLANQGLIDPNKVAIRGGSAGGYTTLRALTTSDVFKAGASYYGVADLAALARDTHKFESEYLFALVPKDQMDIRSPINHIDSLSRPVICYQGQEDSVVPPNQSIALYDALKSKGITTAIFLFDGEGHGFRNANHIKLALESEFLFFSKVFGIAPHEENLDCFQTAQLVNASW